MTNHAKEQARAQYESIAQMVAALECDYDRLEELRDERSDWLAENPGRFIEPNDPRDGARWALAFPDEAEELAELSEAAGEYESLEDAERAIREDPLSVEVRTGWYPPGDDKPDPEEFQILLCTGGPAVRIRGELDQWAEPASARLQYQDWFTPWTDYLETDEATLLAFCREFYFGEH